MSTKAEERLVTPRLILRRPSMSDAERIFARYAADPDVVRYLSWPLHRSLADTRAFLEFSEAEWERAPAGPYLVEARHGGRLLGGTGLFFETPGRAMTGYALARDSWGCGFATEALHAMVELAGRLGVRRLYALCHVDHRPSARVLEKGGFEREGVLRAHTEFPNLAPGEPQDVCCYALLLS